ncbi:hypothetical protein ALQ88_00348 [Pseudomonas savastanoi]|nr:hypothetical protein ALQ88_00348 [Pseudomonas savastanoi]
MVRRVAAEVVGGGNRADVDDVPAVTLDHTRQRKPGDLQYRAQVHIDQQINPFCVGLEQRTGPVDSGIVDHNIELMGLEQCRQTGQISHVDSMCDAAGALRQCRQLVCTARQRMNLQTFGTQPFDDGFANTGRSAGHQRSFVIGKRHVGVSLNKRRSAAWLLMLIALYWTLTSVMGSDQDTMVVWQ